MSMRVFIATVAVLCCSPLAIADIFQGGFTITMEDGTQAQGSFDATGNHSIPVPFDVTSFTFSYGGVHWATTFNPPQGAEPHQFFFYGLNNSHNTLNYQAHTSEHEIRFFWDATHSEFQFFTDGSAGMNGTVTYHGTLHDDDGNEIPAPAAICLLGLAGFASRRRRRS